MIRLCSRSLALLALLGCSNSNVAPDGAPLKSEQAKKPAAPKVPTALNANMHGVGAIRATTPPTIDGIDAALPTVYEVRPSDGTVEGSGVQVLYKGQVILDVFANEDNDRILRIVARHQHVVFPWETTVGMRVGDHKNWERMICDLAPAPFEGEALCSAFEAARVSYLVKGWQGDGKKLPGKELMADLKISGLVWAPKELEEKE